MKATGEDLFCGLHGFEPRGIFGSGRMSNYLKSSFRTSQLYFTHKGRTAIRKAFELINIEPGDEILVPSYNCGSEVDPILKAGGRVELYRVDRSSMIDLDDLRLRINTRTKAVYVTHYFGFPQEIGKIKEICDATSIYLIEDCALSLFSKNARERLGAKADIAIFSLTKTLPLPDGGFLVVNNPDLIQKSWYLRSPDGKMICRAMLPLIQFCLMRILSECQFTKPFYSLVFRMHRLKKRVLHDRNHFNQGKRHEMLKHMYYDERLSNRKLSGLSMCILLSCDPDHIISKRRENYKRMLSLLKGCDRLEPLFRKLPPGTCPLYFPVIVRNREDVLARIEERGIDAHAWWKGYHSGLPWDNFPAACFLKDNIIALPIHQQLSRNHVEYIAENIVGALP